MKRKYVKKLLSLVIVILLVFPSMGLSSALSPSSGMLVRNVYFQDGNGNMVFVDYEEAINQAIGGNPTLYAAIQSYVGEAEEKGRPLYLETNTGIILDYRKAMTDNLFRLQEILGNDDYVFSGSIDYTHELRVVDGVAVIADVEVHSEYTMEINGPTSIEVDDRGSFTVRTQGNGAGNVNYTAIYEYSITGGQGVLEYLDGDSWVQIPLSGTFGPRGGFTLTPNYDATTSLRFSPSAAGTYSITILLKDLGRNVNLATASRQVNATVTIPDPDPSIVSIAPVNDITVVSGTSEAAAIAQLSQTTTIRDSENQVHTVNLHWSILNYNANEAGDYTAVGTFTLPAGIANPSGIELKVEATVTVVEVADWPEEVEEVYVGISDITQNTYANIQIKPQYLSVVEAVYVDGTLANQMELQPNQWRAIVPNGTSVDDLRGKILVVVEETPDPDPVLNVTFRKASPFLPVLHVKVMSVENLLAATQYDVTYMLSGGILENTNKVNIGQETEGMFFNGIISPTVRINLYNQAGEVIYSEDIVPVLN